ncbi:MAG: ribosome small subunit-dependent GTPase A [Candidatus Hydrogenedentes bacterium]|nr:ribosome small subunit-dependent GTPase A [Candidatus Hydrogenedentota bacterium]
MKKKKLEKKKRKTTRTRDWEHRHEDSFTHDLARHRKAQVTLAEPSRVFGDLPTEFEPNATVISHAKKWAVVRRGEGELLCLVDERLQEEDATLLAPGDQVLIEEAEGQWTIRGIAPRRTKLSRPAGPHARVEEQVFAANVDLLLMMASVANPPFRSGLIDRFLIAAQLGGVEPVLIINKMDLVAEEPEAVRGYRDLGIRVINTSCVTGQGVETLRTFLRGKLSVLSGHSGVGKSSLLMALDPQLELDTQEITSMHRGRHTTTASRLYVMHDDIRIIDTPGIRALGLWDVSPAEVAYYFPDIAEAAQACQFREKRRVAGPALPQLPPHPGQYGIRKEPHPRPSRRRPRAPAGGAG